MTNERYRSLSDADKRPDELPIMRRSRSLSELPGHLRVPILQRKDTERTRARLEAGAAGVKELRALRDQQQGLIDQAMATAQPKWKQQTLHRHAHSLTDHHRVHQHHKLEQHRQQMNSSFSSPLSTWHSACSLASISEERDQTLNISANKNTLGSSMNDHRKTKITQLRNAYYKQNECMQSQDFYRGRSQSVHGDFFYSPDAHGNETEEMVSSPSSLPCSDNKSGQGYDLSLRRDVHITDIKCRANRLESCTNTHTSINEREQNGYQILPQRPSLRVRSQSMSWDNLLAIIGLQSDNNVTTNESMEQDREKCDDVFTDDKIVSKANASYPASSDDEYFQTAQIKKMRSQSFTSGCSKYSDLNHRLLSTKSLPRGDQNRNSHVSSTENIMDENIQSEATQGHFCELKKQASEKLHSVSLLRRASIQCEAVLTQTNTPRKIMNPLQDVDINSLRSPGPLHAVTLQYSSMPMKELSVSRPNIAASSDVVPGEQSTPSNTHRPTLDTEVLSSSASTEASRRHNSIIESAYNSETVSKSKQFKAENSKINFPEPSLSEVIIETMSKEHPKPKPRKSIPKGMPSQEATSQVNSCLESSANRKHNMAPRMLQKSTIHESNRSNHIEPGRGNATGSFTPTSFTSMGEAEQSRWKQKLDNKNIDTVAVYERENQTPQKDFSDCSSIEKTTPDFKVNSDIRRNVSMNKSVSPTVADQNPITLKNFNSPTGRSQIQSNSEKKNNQSDCSQKLCPPKRQLFHTRDVSILSDEGYSTCDSTSSPQSQLSSVGSLQSCGMSSPRCSSLANITEGLNYSSEKPRGSFQKPCMSSAMESYVKHERNVKNSFNHPTKESTGIKGLTGTNKVTSDNPQTYREQCNTLEPKLCPNTENKIATLYHRFHSQGELTQKTDRTNQDALTTDRLQMCDNNIKTSIDDTVVKTDKCPEIVEEAMTMLTQSNNPTKDIHADTAKMFKQTSV